MRMTQYFMPILRENPAEAQIVSHRLMLRAGMIRQAAAGIYSWLPLGLRVMNRIVEHRADDPAAVPAEKRARDPARLLLPQQDRVLTMMTADDVVAERA